MTAYGRIKRYVVLWFLRRRSLLYLSISQKGSSVTKSIPQKRPNKAIMRSKYLI